MEEKKINVLRSHNHLTPTMRLLKAIHSVSTPDQITPEELEKQRRSQNLLGNLVAPMSGMTWELFHIGSMPAAWMRSARPHKQRHAILYCHGGGYTSGNLGYSKVLASKMTHATGYDVMTFEYRLAPENPYPAAVEDAMRAWDYLMYLGYGARDVVLAGDSAGGNLALVLCHRLKTEQRMLPCALMLMSPWTDMTGSGDSCQERAELDPMLTPAYISAVTKAYAPHQNLYDPELSPLFGDFKQFPPTLIQVGDHEILYSDSVRLRDEMQRCGVPCYLEVWEDMWHVFQMFPFKKASSAIEHMGHFLLDLL